MLNLDILNFKYEYLFSILILFTAMYGPRLQPKLPTFIQNLFNNNYFRLLIIFLIAYISEKSLFISIIVVLLFTLLMSYSNNQEILEKFNNFSKISDFETFFVKENYLPENIPKNLDTQQLNKFYTNIPKECDQGEYNQSCIDYCYSKAGLNDQFCNEKFPKPEENQEAEEIENKYQEEVKSEINSDIYSEINNEIEDNEIEDELINEEEQFTNITDEIKKYKMY